MKERKRERPIRLSLKEERANMHYKWINDNDFDVFDVPSLF